VLPLELELELAVSPVEPLVAPDVESTVDEHPPNTVKTALATISAASRAENNVCRDFVCVRARLSFMASFYRD